MSVMLTLRFFVALFIVISAVIAIVQAKSRITFIAQLMGVSWGALSGSFLAPFLYSLYWKKTTKAAAAFSFAFGTLMMILQLCISLGLLHVKGSFLSLIFKNSLYSGVFTMLASLLLMPLVSLVTQKTCPKGTEEMFSCYKRRVLVTASDVLKESED